MSKILIFHLMKILRILYLVQLPIQIYSNKHNILKQRKLQKNNLQKIILMNIKVVPPDLKMLAKM